MHHATPYIFFCIQISSPPSCSDCNLEVKWKANMTTDRPGIRYLNHSIATPRGLGSNRRPKDLILLTVEFGQKQWVNAILLPPSPNAIGNNPKFHLRHIRDQAQRVSR
eukprot:Gb_13612 [translate_table: standard]